jgi:hypothetical protein
MNFCYCKSVIKGVDGLSIYEKLSELYHQLGWRYEELHIAVEDSNENEKQELNNKINGLLEEINKLTSTI